MEQSKFYKIKNITEQEYTLVGCDGSVITRPIQDVDRLASAFTIQDAKDGDVLANDHHILILKELVYDWSSNGTPYSVKAYCGIKPNGNFEIGKDNWCFCGTLHILPATKEQRDALMKAMKEAGYEWDADKKELKKLVPNKFDPNTLKPFDKVLIRDHSTEKWDIGHFSYIEYDLAGFDFSDCEEEGEFLVYTAGEVSYWYAVPYNEDTKHLVGTTDEAPEYYRYWED